MSAPLPHELAQAQDFIKQNQKAQAQQVLKEYLKQNPRDHRAWYLLSFALNEQNRQIQSLERALTLQPDFASAQQRLQKLTAQPGSSVPPPPPSSEPRRTSAKSSGGGRLVLVFVVVAVLIGVGMLLLSRGGETAQIVTTQWNTAQADGITFDYPEGWELFTADFLIRLCLPTCAQVGSWQGNDAPGDVGYVSMGFTTIQELYFIQAVDETQQPEHSLRPAAEAYEQARRQDSILIEAQTLSIGREAYFFRFNIPESDPNGAKDRVEVWLQRNDSAVVIILGDFPPGMFEAHRDQFFHIVESVDWSPQVYQDMVSEPNYQTAMAMMQATASYFPESLATYTPIPATETPVPPSITPTPAPQFSSQHLPDGIVLAVNNAGDHYLLYQNAQLSLIPISGGEPLEIDIDTSPRYGAFSPDDSVFFTYDGNELTIRDTQTGRRLRTVYEVTVWENYMANCGHACLFTGISFDPAGIRLHWHNADGIATYDIVADSLQSTPSPPCTGSFNPNFTRCVDDNGFRSQITLWNVETASIFREYPIDGNLWATYPRFSADGTRLWGLVTTGNADAPNVEFRVWDAETLNELIRTPLILNGERSGVFSMDDDAPGAFLSHDNQYFVYPAIQNNQTAWVAYDYTSGQIAAQSAWSHDVAVPVNLTPNGRILLTYYPQIGSESFTLWDLGDALRMESPVTAPQDGMLLVDQLGGSETTYEAISAANASRLQLVETIGEAFQGYELSDDGRLLIVSGSPRGAALWDLATMQRITTFDARGAVRFVNQGRAIIYPDQNYNMRVWDIEPQSERGILSAAIDGFGRTQYALSADGNTVAIVTQGETIRIWSLIDMQQTVVIQSPQPFKQVLLDATGTRVIAVSEGSIMIWQVGGDPNPQIIAGSFPVRSSRLASNDRLLLLGTHETLSAGELAAVDLNTGEVLLPYGFVTVSPDGNWVGLIHSGRLRGAGSDVELVYMPTSTHISFPPSDSETYSLSAADALQITQDGRYAVRIVLHRTSSQVTLDRYDLSGAAFAPALAVGETSLDHAVLNADGARVFLWGDRIGLYQSEPVSMLMESQTAAWSTRFLGDILFVTQEHGADTSVYDAQSGMYLNTIAAAENVELALGGQLLLVYYRHTGVFVYSVTS